jgi:hypothetical protein
MRNTVTTQLIGHDLPGSLAVRPEQPPEESSGRLGVSAWLEIYIDDITVLIHGSPQVETLTFDGDEYFVDEETWSESTGQSRKWQLQGKPDAALAMVQQARRRFEASGSIDFAQLQIAAEVGFSGEPHTIALRGPTASTKLRRTTTSRPSARRNVRFASGCGYRVPRLCPTPCH